MPETLKETLRTAIAETATPQQPVVQETKQEPAQAASVETPSGDTAEKEFVSGIDISDVPVQDRPRIREKLTQKAKLLETGYNQKFQEVASYKKERDQLNQLGLTIEEARDVLGRHVEQKRNPTAMASEKRQALKTLDKLIEQSPVEQQAALAQMRQIIKEEAPLEELINKVTKIEQFMNRNVQEMNTRRQDELNRGLDDLKSKYGEEFVDQYRDVVVQNGLQYGGTAKQLFHAIAPADELEQTILAKAKPGKQITTEKANAITSSGPGLTSSAEQINLKQNYRGVLKDIIKLGGR